MMNGHLRALPALALLAISACNMSGSAPSGTEQPPLAGAAIGGGFSLVNQDGKPVSDADFAGKYRILYFGYSYCPDVCPVDLQKLMAGFSLFEKTDPARAAKIQPIFVTVDPARDTPTVLKTYVAAFHPRLIGLTGSEAQIADVAKKYAVVYSRAETAGASKYLVDHSRQAYLFGPKGEPIALLSQDETPQVISDELARWVR